MASADLLTMTDKKTADKQKALDSALAQIERQFGKGSIMKLGNENAIQDMIASSTGRLGLILRWGSVACRWGGSSRSMALNPREKRR